MMASTSHQTQMQDEASVSSVHNRGKYDAFLSFRGKDTRNSFVDHLYSALRQKVIVTFKDDLKLEKGEPVYPALVKAIEESTFAVVIFSENYASSTWCLEELVKILECKKTRGLTVLPVFYKVDPSDIRKQKGSFGEAIGKHERVFRGEKRKVERWRSALNEAASISGWDSEQHRSEASLVEEITRKILDRLLENTPSIFEDFVGLHPRVGEVMSMLEIGLHDTRRMVGICGMGGIGKTTIAYAVYHQIRSQFVASSYLENVREDSGTHGLKSLQESLLSDILSESNIKIKNLQQGRSMIMQGVQRKRVLVVLDDVNHENQLDALVGKLDWYGLGSRIIVTTRNSHLLTIYDAKHVYNVELLNDNEAFPLFCRKAFPNNQPEPGFELLIESVVHYAKGVPLALIVLGSFLKGRNVKEWWSAIDRLKEQPNQDIQKVLRLSYDGLDPKEQEIFLDIACFFKRGSQDYIVDILDACDLQAAIGISVLVDKSLIAKRNNVIEMHDLIRKMGRHIVNEESPKEPGKRSRLWKTKDIFHTLINKTGTERVETIRLNSFEGEMISLSPDAFLRMIKLRLLKLSRVQLPGGLDYLSSELKVLDWYGYPSKCLPSNFQPTNLVELHMSHSGLQQLWTGTMCPATLKYVDLSYSPRIITTPDFTQAENLEKLILWGCQKLIEVDPSVRLLKKLECLDLTDCTDLKVLPTGSWLKILTNLSLSGCSKLENISEVLACTKCLSKLDLSKTCIKELPGGQYFSKLTDLCLQECGELTSLPNSICRLKHLRDLKISMCPKFNKLPENLGELESLESLSFQFSKELTSLPNSICGLKRLRKLLLLGCGKLNKLPDELGELESLKILLATSIAIKEVPSSIVRLKNLEELSFGGCNGGVMSTLECQEPTGLVLPPLSGLCSLTYLDLSRCNISEGILRICPGSLSGLSACFPDEEISSVVDLLKASTDLIVYMRSPRAQAVKCAVHMVYDDEQHVDMDSKLSDISLIQRMRDRLFKLLPDITQHQKFSASASWREEECNIPKPEGDLN